MFQPVRIGAIQEVASDRIEEAPRIKVIVESSNSRVNVIEVLPNTGADICAGDPKFLEQMDGHESNLIDMNANASRVGLGIVTAAGQRAKTDHGARRPWTMQMQR